MLGSRWLDAPLVGCATPAQDPPLLRSYPLSCYNLHVCCWSSQARRATASEAQRSGTDPTRPLRRATAAIPRGASIPHRAKPVLRHARCAGSGRQASPRPKAHQRAPSAMRGIELRDSSKQQDNIARWKRMLQKYVSSISDVSSGCCKCFTWMLQK
jgi:hypothetical protein